MSAPKTQYSPFIFTSEEKSRFMSALGDGFGKAASTYRYMVADLPSGINAGLLSHPAYYPEARVRQLFDGQLPDMPAEETWVEDAIKALFWDETGTEAAPHFETVPIIFDLKLIENYFQTQRSAFLEYRKGLGSTIYPDNEETNQGLYYDAVFLTFKKAWYEYHINAQIQRVHHAQEILLVEASRGGLENGEGVQLHLNAVGILGRLIEQYYWKFMVEKAAERGLKTVMAASAGGKVRAANLKAQQRQWNDTAKQIWRDHPNLTKTAVALAISKRLGIEKSPRHIARFIAKPQ